VVRHTYVRKPASAVFDDHEDVQQSESGRHGDKEVTRQNRPRVILQERRPALITSWLPFRPLRHVLAYGARRDPNSQLDQ
jgi:hypothetical protein